jgi:hypothetical protein
LDIHGAEADVPQAKKQPCGLLKTEESRSDRSCEQAGCADEKSSRQCEDEGLDDSLRGAALLDLLDHHERRANGAGLHEPEQSE